MPPKLATPSSTGYAKNSPEGLSRPHVKSAVSFTNVVYAVRSTTYAISSTAPCK